MKKILFILWCYIIFGNFLEDNVCRARFSNSWGKKDKNWKEIQRHSQRHGQFGKDDQDDDRWRIEDKNFESDLENCKEKGRFPHPMTCTQFLICREPGERPFIKNCPKVRRYDPLDKQCFPIAKARDCQLCKDQDGKRISDDKNEKNYFECEDGVPILRRCRNNEDFDKIEQKCKVLKVPEITEKKEIIEELVTEKPNNEVEEEKKEPGNSKEENIEEIVVEETTTTEKI